MVRKFPKWGKEVERSRLGGTSQISESEKIRTESKRL